MVLERDAGAQQRAFEADQLADPDAVPVQLGTPATRGGKFLAPHRIDNHRMFQFALVHTGK